MISIGDVISRVNVSNECCRIFRVTDNNNNNNNNNIIIIIIIIIQSESSASQWS